MLTYSELINLADQIEEEEEEEPIQTSILPPPQPKQSPEEEAQEESDLGDLNQFMANFYARKKLQRQADGTFIPKTKIKPISVENIQEEFSLDDLEDPSHFLHDEWTFRKNRFIEGLAKLQQDSEVTGSKDLYEYFRDEKFSTSRTVWRAFQNGDWTPQMMEDYTFLRPIFDKAKLGGAGQIIEATKDIAIDVIADPANIATGLLSLFTMGAGGAAVQAGARGLAWMAGKHALARHINTKAAQIAVSPTWQGALQGMSIGLTEGAIDGSIINAATQISEKQTGLREGDFDWGELATATGAGALFGATLGGSIASVGNAIARRSYAKAMSNSDISLPQQVLDERTQKLRNTTPEDIRRFRKASHRYHKMISALPTFGKATTRYLEVAQSASPKLKEFIKLIRYDAFKGILGKDQIDAAVPNFNIRREMREGKLRVTADKFLSKVIHKGQGALGKHSFYNIKMDPIANKQLFSLLTGDHKFNLKTLYKRYYNINPQTTKTTMDGELKDNWKNIPKVKLHGEEVSPEVIGAAFHVRRTLDKAHTDASFIDVIGTDGKVSGTTSLFNYSKKFIKNYLPHVWIYDALEPNKEALVDLLLNTKHTNLLEGQFPTVKGRIATKEIDLKVIDGELKKKNAAGDYIELTAQETDQIKIVSSFDEESKQWTKIQNEELEFILTQQGDYDQVTFKNLFKDEGVSSFRELARKKNPDTDENTIETIARRLKGEALVQSMIDGKYDLHKGLKDVTSDRTAFTQHRAFSELNSIDLFNLGVIETDVPTIFSDYMHKVASSIERTSLFGNTKGEFAERWQIPIQKELMEARVDNPELTLDIIQEITGKGAGMDADSGIMQLYSRVTGIDGARIKNPFARGAMDTTKVAMRLAYLPLAVISSASEPLIALSRADLPDTKDFVKEFAKAGGKQFTKIMRRAIRAGKVVGGKEVRGAPDMSDEDWMDFYQAGIAAEQAMEDRLQGLYGEYHTKAGQYISQQFFKYNLLIPWTQAVQKGAYNFSNARITRILGDLNRGKNFMHQPLTKRAIQRRYEELEEIGINPKEALEEYNQYVIPEINTETITPKGRAWARFDRKERKIYVNESELQKRYKNKAWTKPRVKGVEALPEDQFKSLDEFRQFIYSHERHHAILPKRKKETKAEYENRINQAALNNMDLGRSIQGSFRQSDWKQSDYYDHSITPASSLFAREIILNPSVAEANTPLWYSHPAAQLFVQFMGYPTAFNNIVLKGMARSVVKNPMINGSKVLAATTLMTGVAMLGNMIRSHGESLNLDPIDQVAEGVRRWGGFGPFEIAYKYIQGKKYGRSWLGPAIKAPLGPVPSVIVDSIAYGQTPLQTGGKMVPGFGLLSPEAKRKWNEYLGAKGHRDSLSVRAGLRRPHKKKVRDGLATGGVVNIDNATPEPDERVDRMTGLPYNIQAGAAFIDAEERRGFAEGNLLEDNDPQSFSPTPLPLVPDMRKRSWPDDLPLDLYQSTPVKAIDATMEYVEEPITPKQKARQKVKENDMYRVLTRDEEEYATLDRTELVLYSEEDLRPLNLKMDQTFYTSLPEDSRKAKLEAFRDSSTLGLNVSENPVSGNVRLAGKIQFKNVLRLNVDEVTPDTIADQLSIIRTQNILAAPFLVNPIIKAMKSDLKTRDMVLEMDDQVTQDKRDLIEQSKSFILRQGLLKLGFDAIKYNNGYVLLREHQFLPTEIEEERDARKHGGLLSTLNKRRARYNEGGSTDDENTRQSFRDTAFRMKILGESLRKEDYVKNQEDIRSYRFIQQQAEQASRRPYYTSNERKVAEQWSKVGPTREYTEEELKQKEQYTNKYLMPRNRKAEGGLEDDENTRQSFGDTAFRLKLLEKELLNKKIKPDSAEASRDRKMIRAYRMAQQQAEIKANSPYFTNNDRRQLEKFQRLIGPPIEYTPEQLKQKEQYTNEYLTPRDRKAEGGKIKEALKYAGTRSLETLADIFYDMGDEELRAHEKEAARLLDKGIDRGIVNERERVTIENDRVLNAGDAFNAINHMLLSAKHHRLDKKIALQAKEMGQWILDDPQSSEIDWRNNKLGFEIGEQSGGDINKINEGILQAMKEGRQTNRIDHESKMDRFRSLFSNGGDLDLDIEEALAKEEARLDGERNDNPNLSKNRGLRNRNFGNIIGGSWRDNRIKHNEKAIRFHGVSGVDEAGAGPENPEVYLQFDKWLWGLRAMAHTLRKENYRNKSLEKITNTYSRTDQDTYATDVSEFTDGELAVKDTIDTHDDNKLRMLMKAMITKEVGHDMSPSDLMINEAIRLSKEDKEDSEFSQRRNINNATSN